MKEYMLNSNRLTDSSKLADGLLIYRNNPIHRNRCKIDNFKVDNFKIDNVKIDNFKIDKVQN